jgi:hypothetical protein
MKTDEIIKRKVLQKTKEKGHVLTEEEYKSILLELDNRYYNYIYLNTLKPGQFNYIIDDVEYKYEFEPFYIGKGCGDRLWSHITEKDSNPNQLKRNIIKSILKITGNNPIIERINDDLLECESLSIETKFIKAIGRLDLGTGPLTNLNDGGFGGNKSDSTKLKMSSNRKNISFYQIIKNKYGQELAKFMINNLRYKNATQILQYSTDGFFINEYKSLSDAKQELNINSISIGQNSDENNIISNGFIWKYKIDNHIPKTIEVYNKEIIKVSQYSLNGEFMKKWDSIGSAISSIIPTNKSYKSAYSSILKCCNLKIQKTLGYVWRFYTEENNNNNINVIFTTKEIGVNQYDSNMNFMNTFKSSKEAERICYVDSSSITKCCKKQMKTAGGYIWMYSDGIQQPHIYQSNGGSGKKIAVIKMDLDGKELETYLSVSEAERMCNIFGTSISAVCRGKNKTAGGFKWKYLDVNDTIEKISKSVVRYDLNHEIIDKFTSCEDAAKKLNISASSISRCCRRKQKIAGNYIWRYSDDAYPLNDMVFKKPLPSNTKMVIQYDFNLNKINTFESLNMAEKTTTVNSNSISKVCRKLIKQAGGYFWTFADDVNALIGINPNNYFVHKKSKIIIRLTLGGIKIDKFLSVSEASKQTGVNRQSINDACMGEYKQAGGYLWKFEDDMVNSESLLINFIENKNYKSVVKLNLQLEEIDRFKTLKNASKSTNITVGMIKNICEGKMRTDGEFTWRYLKDYELMKNNQQTS